MLDRAVRTMPDLGGRVRRADVLLALALAVPSALQVLWLLPIASPGVGLAVAAASTLPIAWRRTRPVAAALVGSAAWLVPTDRYLVLGYVAAFFLYYSVGAHVADVRRVVAVAAAGLALGLTATAMRADPVGEYLSAALAVTVPPGVGRFVRRQRAQAERLERLTRHLEREREGTARAAVAEERARIARELHDVVSHGVSLIAVQSDAAEAALDHDPDLARAPLATIRGSAREALTEMRRLLDMLRAEGEPDGRVPLPGLTQLPVLLDQARAAGVPVALEVDGSPREVPASVDLSAYRIVQEALTNVRKHAASAATTVGLTWSDDALRIRVRDRGPGPSPGSDGGHGHGLVGMRERVRLHRGSLRTGAGHDGGFEVDAVLRFRSDGS